MEGGFFHKSNLLIHNWIPDPKIGQELLFKQGRWVC